MQKKKKKKASGSGGSLMSLAGPDPDIIAENLERQAATQKNVAAMKSTLTPAPSPYEMLQSQLFDAVNNINVAPTPLEQLRQMAMQQVAAQFDPQINALSRDVEIHGKRAASSAREARGMYGALAKDYLSQLPELTQQFAAEDKATDARYDQAQQQMTQQYQKQAADQEAVLRRLGIEAALPDTSQQARDDQSYFQNQMEMDQQSARNALDQQQIAQSDYTRNLGNNARMAGENTAEDFKRQFQDYAQQAGGQIATLQGQKGSAVEALLAQMQQQDAQRVSQQRQQEFDNMMKLFNFQLSATNAAQRNAAESNVQNPFDPTRMTTGLAGAQNYLAQAYPGQETLASNLMNQINDVLANPDVKNGKFILEPGDPAMGKAPKYADMTQEKMMELLRHEFEKEGDRYTTGDINATMNALLAYLGKTR
ncbi:hypothetical protein [Streptomyces griseosporeus]|uniref:hypothetical protein n=1 Tax=Streptomyces griseosporeus TaxID=1910 RepID=UPI00167CFF97|nr:hypothetical protein [Streptomyces griseosporeus]